MTYCHCIYIYNTVQKYVCIYMLHIQYISHIICMYIHMMVHINTSYYISYIPHNISLTIDMNKGQNNKDPAIDAPKQNSPSDASLASRSIKSTCLTTRFPSRKVTPSNLSESCLVTKPNRYLSSSGGQWAWCNELKPCFSET